MTEDEPRGELHVLQECVSPQAWMTWIWQGIKQFEELLAKHARFVEEYGD